MSKIISYALATIALLMTLIFLWSRYDYYQATNFSCSGKSIALNSGDTVKLNIFVSLRGKHGEMTFDGEHVDRNAHITPIRSTFYFSFNIENDVYHFITNEVVSMPSNKIDNQEMKKFFPYQIFTAGSEISMSIYRNNVGGYIFKTVNYPILYCAS